MATTARFTDNDGAFDAGTDNTDRVRNNQYLTPAYAATLTIKPYCSNTLIKPAALTGALTLNLGVGGAGVAPFVGDVVDIHWQSDGTTRTVTYGTGIQPTAATQVITTAKFATASFRFDGVAWVEIARSISV